MSLIAAIAAERTPVRKSDEDSDVGWFTLEQAKGLDIASGYLRAVCRAFRGDRVV